MLRAKSLRHLGLAACQHFAAKLIAADNLDLDLDPSLSCGDAPWKNLIIEGDNFDELRYLNMTFMGRVKCIYIDPPYNTGNKDFVYNDHFVEKEDLWRHSTWCEFMYQRLSLAKDLLREDGVIFVSIDDNEMPSLRLLMDRIFGGRNFVTSFIWKKVDSPNDNKVPITPDHEYILCFALNKDIASFSQMSAPHIVEAYGSKDENGVSYRDRLLKKNGKNSLRKDRPTMFFSLIDPDGNEVFPIHENGEEARWAMGRSGIEKHQKAKTLIWKKRVKLGKEVWEPYTREFAPSDPSRPYPTIWNDLPTMRQAKAVLREIFGTADLFSTPKPHELIERILRMSSHPDDIIVDFFAGSGTTAHSVLKLNEEDDGNRRFILVSSTEATTENPDKNICRDICASRVRSVIQGYGESSALDGDFAYLRTRTIPPSAILDIEHDQVWTALQLIHRPTLTPYTEQPFLIAEDEEGALIYVPSFEKELIPSLREAVKQHASVIVYSWQPGLLRQHLRSSHVQHEAIPESLLRRFGLKS